MLNALTFIVLLGALIAAAIGGGIKIGISKGIARERERIAREDGARRRRTDQEIIMDRLKRLSGVGLETLGTAHGGECVRLTNKGSQYTTSFEFNTAGTLIRVRAFS